MVQALQKNKRFQEDVNRYKSHLEKLPESNEKIEFKKLLDQLIFEVKKMDNMYLDMVYSNQLSSFGTEIRDQIVNLRKQLDNKIKQSNL